MLQGVRVINRSASLLELCLTEFYDRAEAKLIASLRQLQSLICVLEQLCGHPDSLIGGVRLQPGGAHVADDSRATPSAYSRWESQLALKSNEQICRFSMGAAFPVDSPTIRLGMIGYSCSTRVPHVQHWGGYKNLSLETFDELDLFLIDCAFKVSETHIPAAATR